MGKNYNNYSKKEKEEIKQENVKEEIVETVETVESVEVEDEPVPTEESVEQETVKEVSETIEDEPTLIEVPPSKGIVFNCEKLNIRKGPDKKEKVLCIVNKGSKLTIHDKDTSDWFNVTTEDGVEGFCMKKFVDLIIP